MCVRACMCVCVCTAVLEMLNFVSCKYMSFILVLVQVGTGPDALRLISTLWMEVNQQINWILIPVTITTLSSPPFF